LSLGIEVNAGQMHVLIPRNTTIPTEKSEDRFTTAVDNQPAIDVKVLQGERPLAKDNKELGVFRLEDLPPAQRGVPQFEITFKIDANGILKVKAKDKGTGKEKDITITASTQLEQDEVDKLIKEAEENATKDKEEMEKLRVRNDADSYIFQAEKLLRDYDEKMDKEDKKEIEDIVKDLKEEISKDDADEEAIKTKSQSLMESMQKVGSKVYESAEESEKDSDNNGKEDENDTTEGEVVDEEKGEDEEDKK
jgi:molecular chaperone DnaK